uniref:Uncharacterized protein n=2 Tax=Clastoptera arizonana TaxID=38151 RepID=A0A1B6DPC0_9HEMI
MKLSSPGPLSPTTPTQPGKVNNRRTSGQSQRASSATTADEKTLPPISSPPPVASRGLKTPTPLPLKNIKSPTSPTPVSNTSKAKPNATTPPQSPLTDKKVLPILSPVNTQTPQVGGGAAATAPVAARAEEPPAPPSQEPPAEKILVNGHHKEKEIKPSIIGHVLTNPGPEYWRLRNPVADEIFITDVTVNLNTVTIRECKTEKGFFRERSKSANDS